jgi:hypothetical protein
LVRTNPIYTGLSHEIDKVIDFGADMLMLPMATDRKDAELFVKYIGGRAKVNVMIESVQALARVDSILDVDGVDEFFIGLNDLHLGLGLNFMFEVLSGGLVEYIAEKCNKRKVKFGFGGIARIGDGILPAEYILGEHYRLGSNSVILSRTFKGNDNYDLELEVKKVRNREKEFTNWKESQYIENMGIVIEKVNLFLENIK